MAKKIGLLRPHESKPKTFVKKCVALLMVRRNAAEWVNAVTIRLRPERVLIKAIDAIPADIKPKAYIPDKMPANLDARMGLIVQIPALANQIRFRHF